MNAIRELITWVCPRCDNPNVVGIPAEIGLVFTCYSCQETSELADVTWKLNRSLNCPDCKGTGTVIVGHIRICGLCNWSNAELSYSVGTRVTYIPHHAKHSFYHPSVENGVVVNVPETRPSSVHVSYVSHGELAFPSKLTAKEDLYLNRWTDGERVQKFLEARMEHYAQQW